MRGAGRLWIYELAFRNVSDKWIIEAEGEGNEAIRE